MSKRVEGYFWHLECLHGEPGSIRRDDGGEPRRGTFVDRAITMGHARRLDGHDSALPTCHPCLKLKDRRTSEGQGQEDFVVLSYELTSTICTCGYTHNGFNHDGRRRLTDEIWMDAPAMEGVEMADKLVCGDCWYKDNDVPPPERETRETAIECHECGDPVTEVVVVGIKGKTAEGMIVDTDEIDEGDDPSNYKVKVTWTRQHNVTVHYEYIVDDLDADDLQILRDGDFGDIAFDIACDESTDEHETGEQAFYDYCDDGPEDIAWEAIAR